MTVFWPVSGIGLENLRAAAAEPGFLAAILAHLAADEKLLLAFAAHAGKTEGMKARASLALQGRMMAVWSPPLCERP